MKYSLVINLFLAQCLSVYALDQNIPVSDEYQRRVQEVVSNLPVGVPVSYECDFINRWTSSRHPNQFPGSGHWSTPLMASHNKRYTMWSDMQVSSAGVEKVAEKGALGSLTKELAAAGFMVNDVASSSGSFFPSGGDFASTPIQGLLDMDNSHRLISSITKIEPSPDWFSGLNSYSPVMNDRWLSSFNVYSYPWDAGSEDGSSYSGSNLATDPKVESFRFTVDTVPSTNIFVNTAEDDVLPVAQWSCTLVPGACREDKRANFFQRNSRGGPRMQDRSHTCKWLGMQRGRISRNCRKTRDRGDQPTGTLPLAREVCRETCGTCPTTPSA